MTEARDQLCLAQNTDADRLLAADPFALLIGMLLDQQVPMEKAFTGPWVIAQRLGLERLDPAAVAGVAPEQFEAVMATPPAVHRYPASMGARVQALAAAVVSQYDGDVTRIWDGAPDAATLLTRLKALPGFGPQKAKIFVALLAKQRGVALPGWQAAAGDYGQPGYRSVADVVDGESLLKVRETKRAAKAAARG
jgi:uncharacterized HhH-GPD family protein